MVAMARGALAVRIWERSSPQSRSRTPVPAVFDGLVAADDGRGPAGAGAGFRLVDAEGLISEPAHDLGVILVRGVPGWIGDLAGGDPRQVLEIVARRCRHAGRLAGAGPDAVWQWAFTELVSTGLFLLSLGQHGEAETFLAVAGKLAAATANGQPGRLRQDPASGQADGPAGHTTGK